MIKFVCDRMNDAWGCFEMMLRFSFENFRSFRKKTTLSMVATAQRTLNDVLIRKDKHRILPVAVLYGPNASGKSNVVLAMLTLREIISNGSVAHSMSSVTNSLELFPFIHDCNLDPITFEIEFIDGDSQFIYKLSIGVEPLSHSGKRHIIDERLDLVLQKDTVMLFHRTKNNITVGEDKYALRLLEYQDSGTLQGLVDSIVQNMDEKTLFLTGGFKSTIRKTIADRVTSYITAKVLPAVNLSESFLNSATILSSKRYPTDGNMIQVDLFDAIIKAADFGPQKIGWRAIEEDSGKQGFYELEMISKYLDSIVPSELMESAGTTRLLRFSLLLRQFIYNGGLMLIDEMDNAIHPEITKGIIALFCNPAVNKNGAQLIFTTHNPIFMDRDILRRDQILFTERNPDTYESTLHSLGDFGSINVRNDQSFLRNYFKGRYGRLPYIDLETVLAHGMEG
jgi:AAA15 family ATPase/GTPase